MMPKIQDIQSSLEYKPKVFNHEKLIGYTHFC